MFRSAFIILCSKKPQVSEEWKALARKQASTYRSPPPPSIPHHDNDERTGGTGGGKSSYHHAGGSGRTSSHHASGGGGSTHSSSPLAGRHFFGKAQYDKNGKLVRDIDPVELEFKVEDYHLSRYK